MTDFYTTLLTLLKQDPRFTAQDGTFLRNAVYEAAMRLDANLLRLLLKNPETKARFFQRRTAFWFSISRFLPGPSITGSFCRTAIPGLKTKSAWPKKTTASFLPPTGSVWCSLTKTACWKADRRKKIKSVSEIFYNELLAPDEIDRLLDPKAFTGARKYTADGETPVAGLSEDDNLIIKGNNLLGLYSILPRFEGRIRCIFIDPPYFFVATKPSDTFSYNSNFKLSTWLVFLRNRLQAAHRLLAPDGICICPFPTKAPLFESDDG